MPKPGRARPSGQRRSGPVARHPGAISLEIGRFGQRLDQHAQLVDAPAGIDAVAHPGLRITLVGDWNRFSANTGGTLVEKCCHYFNLMDLILLERPQRVFASSGQDVNHLDESYGGKRPDILDNAFVIVEYGSGARAHLDLCMFAENSVDNEHITIVGDEGKLESLLPSGTLRHGRREDWGLGQHFGASYVEHQRFAAALRAGRPAEIGLEEGLRSVATGLAAHRSIDERRVVEIAEVLP